MIEQLLQDYSPAYGLSSVSLRYFNAAGADRDGELGEEHTPETHLIPNILKAAKGEEGVNLKIFGDDYNTPDGTCVRDYIHVEDLCSAHLQAAKFLETNSGAHAFNLGNGNGFSVKQVLNASGEVVGSDIPHEISERRPGDADTLVADATKANELLGWKPDYTDVNEIVATAWNWIGVTKG